MAARLEKYFESLKLDNFHPENSASFNYSPLVWLTDIAWSERILKSVDRLADVFVR